MQHFTVITQAQEFEKKKWSLEEDKSKFRKERESLVGKLSATESKVTVVKLRSGFWSRC